MKKRTSDLLVLTLFLCFVMFTVPSAWSSCDGKIFADGFEARNFPPVISNVQAAGVSKDITISYDLHDDEGDRSSITVEYRGGSAGLLWFPATVTGATTGLAPGKGLTITWNSAVDVLDESSDDFTIKITPCDNQIGTPGLSQTFSVSNIVPKRYALVAGIDQYQPDLELQARTSSVTDASSFVTYLLDDAVLWHNDRVSMLIDSTATKTSIRSQLRQYALLARSGDLVVYYHSGHSGQQVTGTQQAYLVAHDDYYQDYELAQDLQSFAPGVSVVVIVDASFAAGLFDGLNIAANLAWITSSPWDEANYHAEQRFSLFTSHLLAGFRLGDSNSDGDVSFMELFNHVSGIAEPNLNEQKFGDSVLGATIAAALAANHLPVATDVNVDGNSGEIAVSFDLSDVDPDTHDILVEYRGGSVGSTWTAATVLGETTGLIPAQNHVITWQSDVDEGGTIGANLEIRITPSDQETGDPGYSGTFSINNNSVPVVSNVRTTGTGGDIIITYDLDDADNDLVDVEVHYRGGSAGMIWVGASVSGTTTGLTPSADLTLTWQSGLDEPGTVANDMSIKITPSDLEQGVPGFSGDFAIDNRLD